MYRRQIIFLWCIVASIICVSWLWVISNSEKQKLELIVATYKNLSNLTRSYKEHVQATLQEGDKMLLFTKARYKDTGQITKGTQEIINSMKSESKYNLLAIINKDGTVEVSTDHEAMGTSLAGQEYFSYHKRNDSQTLHIDRPFLDKGSGKWSFAISRRIDGPSGSFEGVAVAVVDASYFTDFYRKMELDDTMFIVMIGTEDAIIRGRQAADDSSLGQYVPNAPVFNYLKNSPKGIFNDMGAVAHRKRFMAYELMPSFPLVVVVGIDEEAALNQNTIERVHNIKLLSLETCILLFITSILSWSALKNYKSKIKYELLFTEMNEAFSHQSIICDELGKPIDYRFITINPSFEMMTGLKLEAIIGKTASVVFSDVDQTVIEIYGRVALTGESVHFNTFLEKLNKYFEIKVYSPALKEFATIFMDITERVKNEKDIHYLNYHDVLTGLYNRRFYEEELKRLDTKRNLPISIIFCDVNGLKLINDAFGHLKGDELLQKAARAMQNVCRADDIIARWGGDEFVILLPKTDVEEAKMIAKRIRETYSKEQVNSISGSISLGWDTKWSMSEDLLVILKNSEDLMYKHKTHESKEIRFNTIKTLMSTLKETYLGTEQDSKKISELCHNIGKAIGMSESEVVSARRAGYYRDIGNVSIDESILNKHEKLTNQEWDEIKRHPEVGFRILSSSHETSELADCVLGHHERWDGTGYPKGLQGDDIPIAARIIAIVSSYVAMTSDRPYRSVFSEEEALQEILKNSGTQFDPEITKVFAELLLDKLLE